jgi:protein tyrosine phosphatase (PTP) superfamily phosphohydrolase (DUF442 family)
MIFRNPWFFGNFGIVEPDRVYRSAQPEGELDRLITRFRLASVLNLRGGTQDDPWYAEEVRATREHAIEFYDLPMSATRRPQRRELILLLDVLDQCSYPLLIHCKSGSDRTGLAVALYLMSQRGQAPEQALRAFSLHYGHIPLLGPEHLHEPLDEYAAWLKVHGQAHSPARFRFWVEQLYDPVSAGQKVPKMRPGARRRSSGAVSVPIHDLGEERGGLAGVERGRDVEVGKNGRSQGVVEANLSPGAGFFEVE